MAEYRLTPRAREDLSEILAYSESKWSPERAELYVRDLFAAFRRLANAPLTGVGVRRTAIGLRQSVCRSHLIFYFPRQDYVEIVRVLHGSRNIPEILDDL